MYVFVFQICKMSDVEDMDIQPDTIIEEDPPFKATLGYIKY